MTRISAVAISTAAVLCSLLVSAAPITAQKPTKSKGPDMLAAQVLIARAKFSPGEIDGRGGANTNKAIAAFEKATGTKLADALAAADAPPTVAYTITAEDAGGPFLPIPEDMMEKAKLKKLDYTSVLEALGERFHAAPTLLKTLNPSARFVAGEQIQVPNVLTDAAPAAPAAPAASGTPATSAPAKPGAATPATGASAKPAASGTPATGASAKPAASGTPAPGASAKPPASGTAATGAAAKTAAVPGATVTVSKSSSALTVADASGKTIFYAPVTTGSKHDPLPIGQWAVTAVVRNPTFNYNPDLFWDADPAHAKAKIPAGPNGPVGVVWIDISKEHYGLHGTPEPRTVGHTASHGCVRLTNWDAMTLASLVGKGTKVLFVN